MTIIKPKRFNRIINAARVLGIYTTDPMVCNLSERFMYNLSANLKKDDWHTSIILAVVKTACKMEKNDLLDGKMEQNDLLYLCGIIDAQLQPAKIQLIKHRLLKPHSDDLGEKY